jgi:hypothetical protein
MKEILLEMVADLQDLRANLSVLAVQPKSIGDAQDAKTSAIQGSQKSYDALRAKDKICEGVSHFSYAICYFAILNL